MRFKLRRTSDSYINFNETPPCKNDLIELITGEKREANDLAK